MSTITAVARAGVISKREERLRPGETRPAAVLFIDVVGFTELSTKLGSENIATLIDRTFRIFELTVKAHGGYCDKVIGDAALYVFAGHPNYPPVCEAALKAALKLAERLRQVNESLLETGVELAIRQGVTFGDVTKQAVGSETAQVTVMGDTVNSAQRLEASAAPGTVQTTARVVENAGDMFDFTPLGQLELKGLGLVPVFRLDGIRESDVHFRGAYARLTPLVGRDAELEAAYKKIAGWHDTRYGADTLDITKTPHPLKGRNRLVVIRGVPAVGKSRLAYELAEKIKRELGASTATGHLSEHASLKDFTAELARVAGVTADNLPERWESLCANAASLVSPEYAERQRGHLRLLAYVLDCPRIDAKAMGQADAARFALNCQLAIRACCELAAQSGTSVPDVHFISHDTECRVTPVVLIIEDLQWMGDIKPVLADVIARASLPFPLVVIATARPEYGHEDGALGEGECFAVNLETLGREMGNALVQAMLPGLTLPAKLEDELHEKAAGIPYFYEEFCRMLVRRGLVAPASAPADKTSAGTPIPPCILTAEIESLDIPEDIHVLMLGRLDMLEADLKAIAQRASILGRSFEKALLTEIEKRLGNDHEGHPDDELDALIATRLLVSDDADKYFYEHLLLRDAAYASLLLRNRRILHNIAADVLEKMLVPGTSEEWTLRPALVGHLEAAKRCKEAHEQACDLLKLMAGTGRYEDWDAYYAVAVKLWGNANAAGAEAGATGRVGVSADGIAKGVPADGIAKGVPADYLSEEYFRKYYGKLPHHRMASAVYFVTWRIHKNITELNETAREIVAETIMHFNGIRYQVFCYVCMNDHVHVMVRMLGNRRLEETVHSWKSYSAHQIQRRVGLQGAIWQKEYFDRIVRDENEFSEKASYILNNPQKRWPQISDYKWVKWLGSKFIDAAGAEAGATGRVGVPADGIAKGVPADFSSAVAVADAPEPQSASLLHAIGVRHWRQGRMSEARAMLEESLAIRREIGDKSGEAYSLHNLGNLHSDQSRMEEARAMYEESLAIFRELGDRRGEASLLNNLGNLHRDQGRMDEARVMYEESLAIKREMGDRRGEAASLNNLGNLHRDQNRMDEARTIYEESLEICREIGDTRGEALLLNNLGSLHRDQRKMDEARAMWEESLAIRREIGDRRGEAASLNSLGLLNWEQGRMDKARAMYEESLAIKRELGDRRGEAISLGNLGVLHSNQGRMDEARAMYEESLAIDCELGDRRGEAYSLSNIAKLQIKTGELSEARETLALLIGIVVEIGDIYVKAFGHCGYVNYWIAVAGVKCAVAPASAPADRKTAGTPEPPTSAGTPILPDDPESDATIADCIENARVSLAEAEKLAAELGTGAESELGQLIAKSSAALLDFAREHGFTAHVQDLIGRE